MFAQHSFRCLCRRFSPKHYHPQQTTSNFSSYYHRRQQTHHPLVVQLGKRRQQHGQVQRRLFSNKSSKNGEGVDAVVEEPSFKVLKRVALAQAIPFVGFGFMDNAILIVAGDAIDTTLGVVLGISTLCAAAIGNIVSDLAGIGLGTVIEDFCAQKLGLKVPDLTTAQRRLRKVRFAGQFGMAIGMTIGCILGMFPLLFIDSDKIQNLKKKAHLEALFMDVVSEAKTLVGAESTCLYLRVTKDKVKHSEKHSYLPYCPAVDGEFLYAMYYVLPDAKTATQPKEIDTSRFIPIGEGIVSRAVTTAKAHNIHDVKKEPDFSPIVKSEDGEALPLENLKQMIVVPVLDVQGRPIAVIRALNKGGNDKEKKEGFTDKDVEILKSLASHISVSLSVVYQEQDDEEVRLRDTIRILRKQAGINK